MKRKVLRFLALLLSLVMIIPVFGACGKKDNDETSSSGSAKKVTLKFTHIWSEHADSFVKICDNFMALYPNVKIQINIKTYANIDTALSSAYGTNQFPDVCFYWTHGMRALVNDELQMAADITETYYNVHKNEFIGNGDCFVSGIMDNKVYNVPFRSTGFVIYYNKTAFEEAGITEVPKNIEDFEIACKKIKDNTDYIPLGCYGPNGTLSYVSAALSAYADIISGKATDANYRTGRLASNDEDFEQSAQILEKVRNWCMEGYFGSNPMANSSEGVTTYFLNSQSAMAMINNNDLYTIKENMDDEVGCFALPGFSTMENPVAGYVSGGYDGFFISKSCKNKDWALKFLEYLNSKESQQLFSDEQGSIMSRNDVIYTDKTQQEVANCMKNVGVLGTFPDYNSSAAADASSTSVNNYINDKNGNYEKALNLIKTSYNDKVAALKDSMLNYPPKNVIAPTYSKNSEALKVFMDWVKSRL